MVIAEAMHRAYSGTALEIHTAICIGMFENMEYYIHTANDLLQCKLYAVVLHKHTYMFMGTIMIAWLSCLCKYSDSKTE